MSDPFFEYFKQERTSISQKLYGIQTPPVKTYVHAPVVELPPPQVPQQKLSDLIAARHSTRDFTNDPLPIGELSTLLHWSCGMIEHQGKVVRPQASGGAKYPLEPYLLVKNVEGLQPGAYHYNIEKHLLEQLTIKDSVEIADMHRAMFNYPFVTTAAATLNLTFIKSRSIQKYGGLAYKLAIAEAGEICQNVYLLSGGLSLGCCALGGGDTKEFYDTFKIDGGNEHFVLGIALGIPSQCSV